MAFDPTKFKHLPVALRVAEADDVATSEATPFAKAFLKAHDTAATDPLFGTNGKPRMLRVSLWMAHADVANRNGDGFHAADLRAAVAKGLAEPGTPLMLDFDHGFDPIGVWYKAQYTHNPKANYHGVLGHDGVLLEGVIFAWRYAEIADRMLADQSRQGFVEGSMACMGSGYEKGTDKFGDSVYWINDPVFFTCSVLDVPPADPSAKGLVSENPDETPEERERALKAASQIPEGVADPMEQWVMDLSAAADLATAEEEAMKELENLIAAFKAVMGEVTSEQTEQIRALLQAVASNPALEAQVAELTASLEAAEARAVAAEAQVAELETAATERELQSGLIQEQLTAAQAELVVFREAQAEAERVAAEAAAVALREARLAQLPATVQAKLEEMDEEKREKVIAKWLAEDEETWNEVTLAALTVGQESAPDYVGRSKEEGALGSAADEKAGRYAISKFRK